MADILQIKAIKAKPMKIKEVRLELLNALRAEGREVEKLLEQTWSTWEGETPKAESVISLTSSDAAVLTGASGSEKAMNKFKWLDEGTRVRRAVMSSDWKSKTKPGVLKSGRGRGRVVFISKRIRRPGIKARGWSKMIQKQRRRPFTNNMIRAKNRGLSKLYD